MVGGGAEAQGQASATKQCPELVCDASGWGVDRGPPVGVHPKLGEQLVCCGQDGSCRVLLWWEEERCH